ncbi:hypothetical protein NC651_012657 [Populus alba x Populus x berolinensis]|nr:hypothetical protein NC651_012657 [Populus alba x Populus x berolinensis]
MVAFTSHARFVHLQRITIQEHPVSRPCCLIPNPRDMIAQTKRIIMVMSLNASTTKLRKLFAGGFVNLFAPKTSLLCATPASFAPFLTSVSRIVVATCVTPPSCFKDSRFFPFTISASVL